MTTDQAMVNLRMRGRQCHEGESTAHYSILQTRKEAHSTRRIACAALLFAACSAGSMYVLLRNAGDLLEMREFPEGLEVIRPGWAWTTDPAIVRESASLKSTQLGVIPGKQRVLVSEVRGVRARILEPQEGWISCVSDGKQLVTSKEVDDELNQVRHKLLIQQKIQRKIDQALEKRKVEKGVPTRVPRATDPAADQPSSASRSDVNTTREEVRP
mmetsp:Transcript_66567/g.156117  ORF Transcript_66567/g.156117 Transcript_66567/m.156117 type:complete len:214 (-) Transcript_66567:118-759(-)